MSELTAAPTISCSRAALEELRSDLLPVPVAKGALSEIADIEHMGDAWGGAVTAALFLREFVGDGPWAHCDIAGPSYSDEEPIKGSTGFGVSTGVAFLREIAASA